MISRFFEPYQFNIHAIPIPVVSTVIFFIGIFIFSQNRKAVTNISFFMICLCVNLWLYGISFVQMSKDPLLAIKWYKYVTFLGVAYVAPCVYFFSIVWLKLYERQKHWVWAGFAGGAVFYLLGALTPWGFKGVNYYLWGYFPYYGLTSRFFLLFFFTCFVAAFYNFIIAYSNERLQVRKTQIRLIAIAFLISFTGSVDYIPKIFTAPVYPVGYISVFFWIMLVAYTIVKYRALDIQTVVHKTIMWLVTSGVFAAPFVVFSYQAKEWIYRLEPVTFVILLSLVFLGFALYARIVQPHIDHFFQRRQWNLTRASEKFNEELVHLKDLDEVIQHVVNTAKTIFYQPRISFFIRSDVSGELILKTPFAGAKYDRILLTHPFIEWLEKNDRIIMEEYVQIDPRLDDIAEATKKFLQDFSAEVCVPLVVNKKLVALLHVGQKQNLKSYSSSEISFLSDLRFSAAIAIANALHLLAIQENLRKWNEELEKKVEERTKQLKETQAQLVQAEKLATIGTLAGGVAHEINNPLTAVLTNAQILKMTANPDDLESISLIEEGAKRCQIIIQKLMKYARKADDETSQADVDPNKVIQNVTAMLAYQFKQENIDLRLDLKAKSFFLGVPNEIEQVLTNLIINGKDAIKHIKNTGIIRIQSSEDVKYVYIQVTDDGKGIPESIKTKIFDPFFTTKEVGSGTGLGLSISVGIIHKFNGEIAVNSREGEGSTFIIKFPKK